MFKKIFLGLLGLILIIALTLGLWIWSMYEPYPEAETVVTGPLDPLPGLSIETRQALDEMLLELRARDNLPSISLAIGLDGEMLYLGAVGFADLESEKPATPADRYRIGSVSKPVTTVALGLMMEDGEIQLDQNFTEFVSDFPPKAYPFTLRQLASHTAGIRHYVSPLENYHDVHYDTVREALVLVEDDRLIYEPGTRHSYSSYGFNMLSAAMANAAGMPFVAILQERVFDPLGMTATEAEDARYPEEDTVSFYIQTEENSYEALYADNSYKVAGGGLISTPEDLVKLGNALLEGSLLKPGTWEELIRTVPLNDGNTDHSYGIGFRTGTATINGQEVREIGHGGGSVGGITTWKLFPELETAHGNHDLVIAATINISNFGSRGNAHEVAYRAAEIILAGLNAGTIEASAKGQEDLAAGWISLFDGETLDGWTAKVRGFPAGENALDTFRVKDGALSVDYSNYDDFGDQFGHIFTTGAWSHYRLALEYRFLGEPQAGTQGWAYRNSGAMLHAQAPETMPAEQDFPISIEYQFLGGLEPGVDRPTGNLCTPGTHVVLGGEFTEDHCINSSSETYYGDDWVQAEVLVMGSDRVVHFIEGEPVLEYGGLTTGGGVVSGHDPAMKPEGAALGEGHIALQSEGHRVEFRNIRLLNLKGCTDPGFASYRSWYEVADPEACHD